MTRRLRTDRMSRHATGVRLTALLRESADEVRAKVESGEWTVNRARAAYGFPSLGLVGDAVVQKRPDDLPGALQWHGLISEDEIAEWQRAWDQAMADDPTMGRIIHLPSRTVVRTERPRKSPPRGAPRMRKHRRELLINALRWDGPYAAAKAYRILPDELGLGADGPTGQASVDAAFAEHVIKPTVRALPRLMGLPDGIEFRFEHVIEPTDPNGATDS